MTDLPRQEERFVAGALRRIYAGMIALGLAGTVGLLLWKGWWLGLGFAAGATLSYLNFHWLKEAVDVLAGYFTDPQPADAGDRRRAPKPWRMGARFVLRYGLIGVMGYAIFRISSASLIGFLAGLFVFVAAVLAEMIYELTLGIPHA